MKTLSIENFENYVNENINAISESDQVEIYEDILDCEGTVNVSGYNMYPSDILKNCDPIAYNCGLIDYFSCGDYIEFNGELYQSDEFNEVCEDYIELIEEQLEETENEQLEKLKSDIESYMN